MNGFRSKGEPAWPPLALFKAMLVSVWYDLSDVKLDGSINALLSGDLAREARSAGARGGFRGGFEAS